MRKVAATDAVSEEMRKDTWNLQLFFLPKATNHHHFDGEKMASTRFLFKKCQKQAFKGIVQVPGSFGFHLYIYLYIYIYIHIML